MIEESAVVRHTDEGNVVLQIKRTGACGVCEIREQCYRNDGVISVPRNRIHGTLASTDETVRLRIRNTSVLRLTAVVYGVPLVAFFGGLLAGYYLLFPHASEAMQALGSFATALLALGAAAFGIKRFDRRVAATVHYEVDRGH